MAPALDQPHPGDLYVHLAADGGIFVAPGDDLRKNSWVTLNDLRTRVAAVQTGSRILLSQPPDAPLTEAPARLIWSGQARVVAAGPLAQTQREEGITALMSAAYVGARGLVDDLIDRGAKVDERDDKGRTALMLAAQAGETDVVELLHRAGADIEATDTEGTTPVMVAAWSGHASTVERLTALGADPKRSRPRPLDPSGPPVDARDLALAGGHTDAARACGGGPEPPPAEETDAGSLASWRPDPTPVTFSARPRSLWMLSVAFGGAVVALAVAAGTAADVVIGVVFAAVFAGLMQLAVYLGGRIRLTFAGWSITVRPAIGPVRTFDAREVLRIRRWSNRAGISYRVRVRGADGRPGLRVGVPMSVFGQPRAYDELLARIATVPDVDADHRTEALLDAWRRRGSGPSPGEYDEDGGHR